MKHPRALSGWKLALAMSGVAGACAGKANPPLEPECSLPGITSSAPIDPKGQYVPAQVVIPRGNLALTKPILEQANLRRLTCADGSEACVYLYPPKCGSPSAVADKLSTNIFSCGTQVQTGSHDSTAQISVGKVFPHTILRLPALHGEQVNLDPSDTSSDPYFLLHQHALQALGAVEAWQTIEGLQTAYILTAVVDGGVDIYHPDIKPRLEPGVQIPCFQGKCDGYNPEGEHGTAMAGIIAAGRYNGWMIGTAWNTKMLPVRIAPFGQASYDAAAAAAVRCSAHRGARVINFSIAGDTETPLLVDALKNTSDELLFVVPTGNDGKNIDSNPRYPASYALDRMIVVMSHDESGNLDKHSNWGEHADIAAPGYAIYPIPCKTADIDNCYDVSDDNTSNATAYVSGAAALLWSRYPEWSSIDIKWRILETADLGHLPDQPTSKMRRLNLARMMAPVSFTRANGASIGKSDLGSIDFSAAFPPGMCSGAIETKFVMAKDLSAIALLEGDLKASVAIRIVATCPRNSDKPVSALSRVYTVN